MNIHRILTVTAMALLSSCEPIIQESGNPSVHYGAYDRSQGPTTEPGAPLPQTETRTDYPYAEKTSTPGIVISPHAPYNVMDVNGLRPGSLALDQSTNKKFRVP
jgi:hypothetical protein